MERGFEQALAVRALTLLAALLASNVSAAGVHGGGPEPLCIETCEFVQTVHNAGSLAMDYIATVAGPPGLVGTASPASFSLGPGASQDVTVSLDVRRLPSNSLVHARLELADAAMTPDIINESFFGTTFPPVPWSGHKLAGGGNQTWKRVLDAALYHTAPASAMREAQGYDVGHQDDWLVSGPVAVQHSPVLRFHYRSTHLSGKHSVWASSASCDPADGDFVEIAELGPTQVASYVQKEYSLPGFAHSTICVAFRYEGRFASALFLDDVLLSHSTVPATQLPLTLRALSAGPVLAASPGELQVHAALDGGAVSRPLMLGNDGSLALDWDSTSTAGVARGPVYSQLRTTESNIDRYGVSTGVFSGNGGNGLFLADDFVLADDTVIGKLFVGGGPYSVPAPETEELGFYIFPDDGGVPAGDPQTAPGAAAWSYMALPGAPGLREDAGPGEDELELDLLKAGQVLELPAGRWWLVMAPLVGSYGPPLNDEWLWIAAGDTVAQDAVAMVIDPGDLRFSGVHAWTPLEPLLPPVPAPLFRGLSFEVSQGELCGAPWLSVVVPSGSVASLDSRVVQVHMDPQVAGLGEHEAMLCIASNDPGMPVAEIRVGFTVTPEGLPEALFRNGFEAP